MFVSNSALAIYNSTKVIILQNHSPKLSFLTVLAARSSAYSTTSTLSNTINLLATTNLLSISLVVRGLESSAAVVSPLASHSLLRCLKLAGLFCYCFGLFGYQVCPHLQ